MISTKGKKAVPKQSAVAGYIRVSTEPQAEDEKSSLDVQKEAIEKYTKEHDLVIYKIYEDHESGRNVDRTDYLRMKKDAKAGHFKKVIFHKWDRFGRSTREILNVHDDLKELGVDIACVSQNFDTSTPHGRYFMTNLAAFAELELAQIRDRTIMGLRSRAKKGLRIGMAPYGYIWKEKEAKFEIHPEESGIYKRIIHDYLVKGKSQTQIAVGLNKEGVKSSYKKKWTQISVKTILENPAYKGTFRYAFDGREHEVPCPPLIDPKRWDLIQERAKENRNKSKNYGEEEDPFLLRNLLKCGECGYGMYPDWVKRRSQKWRYYVCYVANMSPSKRNSSNVEKTCSLPTIPAEEIENLILSEIKKYFLHPKKLMKIWADQIDSKVKVSLESDLKTLKIKLGKMLAKKDQYWDLFEEDKFDKEELLRRYSLLRDNIEKVRMHITEAEKELSLITLKEENLESLTKTVGEIEKLSSKIQESFGKMTKDQLKGFLKEALAGEKIRVRILRRRDIEDDVKGMTKRELNEPLIDPIRKGRKTYDWTVDWGWMFDLEAAARYLKPLIELINRG